MLTLPALPERLTHAEATAWLSGCEGALQQAAAGSRAVMDAAALREFDSSAVAVLLALGRAARARQLTLEFVGLPDRLRELSTLYGVSELLPG